MPFIADLVVVVAPASRVERSSLHGISNPVADRRAVGGAGTVAADVIRFRFERRELGTSPGLPGPHLRARELTIGGRDRDGHLLRGRNEAVVDDVARGGRPLPIAAGDQLVGCRRCLIGAR
ncbi:hypothetical protein ACQGAO_30615 [Rhodococcus sp. 1.20]